MGQRFIVQVRFQISNYIPLSSEYLQGWGSHHLFEPVLVKVSWSFFFFFLISNQSFLSFIFDLLILILSVWISEEPWASSPPQPPWGSWLQPWSSLLKTPRYLSDPPLATFPYIRHSSSWTAAQRLVWLLSSSCIKPFTLLSDSRMCQMYCFSLLFVDWCVIWAANLRGNLSQAMLFTPVYTCLHSPQYLGNRIVNM